MDFEIISRIFTTFIIIILFSVLSDKIISRNDIHYKFLNSSISHSTIATLTSVSTTFLQYDSAAPTTGSVLSQ